MRRFGIVTTACAILLICYGVAFGQEGSVKVTAHYIPYLGFNDTIWVEVAQNIGEDYVLVNRVCPFTEPTCYDGFTSTVYLAFEDTVGIPTVFTYTFNFYEEYTRSSVDEEWSLWWKGTETENISAYCPLARFELYYIGGTFEISFNGSLGDVVEGKVQPISWTASPGVDSTAKVKLQLSKNNGQTWSIIDTVAFDSNGGSFNWTATGPGSDECKIKLILSDHAGNQTTAISNAFTIYDDNDLDGIPDDGDRNGIAGDNPCTGGDTTNCDDNCPTIANSDQADPDSDGKGSVCDNCAEVYNPAQEDGDADQVGDICDNCPDDPNPGQEDYGEDSLPNACDNCPYMANNDQADSIGDGRGDVCDFFNDPIALPTINDPRAVFVADVNGDAKNDLVYSHTGDHKIYIYINNGDSTFSEGGAYNIDQNQVICMAVDVDNDVDLDIVTANSESQTFSIMKNDGNGNYGPPINYSVDPPCSPTLLSYGRYNSDNYIDLAIGCSSGIITIYFSQGDGTYVCNSSSHYAYGVNGNSVATIDANDDKIADIIVGMAVGFTVMLNDGDGEFPGKFTYLWPYYTESAVASDIDGDRDYDVILRSDTLMCAYFNNGFGQYNSNMIIGQAGENYKYVGPLVSGDFDGDRDNDIAVAKTTGSDGCLELLINNGQGLFVERTQYDFVGISTHDMTVANIDGDKCIDFSVIGSDLSGTFSKIALNKKPVAYVCGDANGDGSVNVADAVFLIAYIFGGGPAPDPLDAGDANCDGSVDVGDAVYIITYVFKGGQAPCCP